MFDLRSERFEVKVPANGISETGQDGIQYQLSYWYNIQLPDDWQWVWRVGGKGEYVGNFPKRVAKWFYQTQQIKIPPDRMSVIGNIASENTRKEPRVYFCDFTQKFDWNDGDFGDSGSCYWGGRAGARQMLSDHDAWAIRFYKDDTYEEGIGRSWVVPWRIKGEKVLIAFNGYGPCDLGLLGQVRVLSCHFNHAYYKRIELDNEGSSGGMLHINGDNHGIGYILGEACIVAGVNHVDFHWDEPVRCRNCGEFLSEDESFSLNDGTFCESCYHDRTFYCENCNETYPNEDQREFNDMTVCIECCLILRREEFEEEARIAAEEAAAEESENSTASEEVQA